MTREEAIEYFKMKVSAREAIGNDIGTDYEAYKIALTALHPISRERVEKAWRGEWKHYLPPLGAGDVQCRCTRCGRTPDVETPFCAWCGAPMTDEAVDIIMRRLETLYETT